MATLFTTDAQPREREPARVPTFPRLRVTDGSVIAPGSALPVGTRFTRVDPPHRERRSCLSTAIITSA